MDFDHILACCRWFPSELFEPENRRLIPLNRKSLTNTDWLQADYRIWLLFCLINKYFIQVWFPTVIKWRCTNITTCLTHSSNCISEWLETWCIVELQHHAALRDPMDLLIKEGQRQTGRRGGACGIKKPQVNTKYECKQNKHTHLKTKLWRKTTSWPSPFSFEI